MFQSLLSSALFSATALLVSATANADVIVCHQTEPFITETFNTDKGTVKVEDANLPAPTIEKGLKFVIRGAGKFEILSADGKVRRALELTGQGSDGMSDREYPFDGGAGINGSIGCESTALKAKNEYR
jgi:uncharacterized membrane protein